jgi:hypothetical protein
MSELEIAFERLSAQYLSKIAEERKKSDDLQLATINNALREWVNKFQSAGGKVAVASGDNHSRAMEQDMLKEALTEAKDRQGKIIAVLVICCPFLSSARK